MGNILKKYPILMPYVAVLIGLYLFSNGWLSLLLYHGMILAYIVFDRKKVTFFKLSKINVKRSFSLSSICFLAGPLAYLLWDNIRIDNVDLEIRLAEYGLYGVSKFIFILYFSIVHPVFEEFFWRIKLNDSLKIFSFNDIAFAGYHILVISLFIKIPFIVLSFIGLAAISVVWRAILRKYDDFLSIIISHAVADMSIIYVALVLLK